MCAFFNSTSYHRFDFDLWRNVVDFLCTTFLFTSIRSQSLWNTHSLLERHPHRKLPEGLKSVEQDGQPISTSHQITWLVKIFAKFSLMYSQMVTSSRCWYWYWPVSFNVVNASFPGRQYEKVVMLLAFEPNVHYMNKINDVWRLLKISFASLFTGFIN